MNSPSRTAPRGEDNGEPDIASRTDVMTIPGWMSVVQASSNTPQPDSATSAAIGAVFLCMSEHYYVCAGAIVRNVCAFPIPLSVLAWLA